MADHGKHVALAALTTLALIPSQASAWCQMTTSDLSPTAAEPCILASNHPGEYPLAWRHRCTSISLSTMDGSFDLDDADVRGVLSRSIATWEAVRCDGTAPGIDIQLLAETNLVSHARHFSDGRNVNSIIFVHEEWSGEREHDPRALAVTYVWHDPSTGEIFDADIELNEETNTFVICPDLLGCTSVTIDTADLENTLTHEMGHYLGVAHTPDDVDATMFASANPGEVLKRDLQPDDEAGLCNIYPPGTLPDACDYTPRGGLGLDGEPPSGCAVRAPGVAHSNTPSVLGALGLGLFGLLLARRRLR